LLCLCSSFCRSTLVLHVPPLPHSYPLSLHDALPISCLEPFADVFLAYPSCRNKGDVGKGPSQVFYISRAGQSAGEDFNDVSTHLDRKSTRLNSSHVKISYAVFCLKKKNTTQITSTIC